MSKQSDSIQRRLWDKVNKKGDEECWEFEGAINSSGYGSISLHGSVRHAHRIAYCLSEDCLDEIDDIEVVRHTCDNPPCCNPNHLLSGDKKDNSIDAVKRKRIPTMKLSIAEVREIRKRYETEDITQKELSEDYPVTHSNICYVVNEETFKFVK